MSRASSNSAFVSAIRSSARMQYVATSAGISAQAMHRRHFSRTTCPRGSMQRGSTGIVHSSLQCSCELQLLVRQKS